MTKETLIAKEMRSAIKLGDFPRVRDLTALHPECIHMHTPFGGWLHVAASFGRDEMVDYFIESGVDVNGRGGILNGAPMNEAASEGYLSIVQKLLDAGGEMDVTGPDRNPLFGAIYGGHLEIVKLLVERGMDHRVRYTGESMKDMDALAFARERGQTEIANYLAGLEK
ncbi:ankyrin repeat domain-containing protein [Luteolibacter sp. LG18]|uniref:ankyrin repeat domain-containing protein n=1 Tax=Luteolibacter sp. LG18 TaxID=2819286 RepID=UPI002B2FBF52|nr:hypothetical protein llg_27210 [Luteolibacter sp. LG18]